jgi:transposase-like protein
MNTRAVPFYCPYCGEEDLEPQGAADGEWHCRSCTRSFQLRFAGIGAQAPAVRYSSRLLTRSPYPGTGTSRQQDALYLATEGSGQDWLACHEPDDPL